MLPVYDFLTVKNSLPTVHSHGARVCGFFLFVESNHPVMKYMNDNALIELDIMLTGAHHSTCGIFTFEPTDTKWLSHARSTNNLWWRTYGITNIKEADASEAPTPSEQYTEIQRAIHASSESVSIQINQQETMQMKQLVITDWQKQIRKDYNRGVVVGIANYFGVQRNELPGVILFASLRHHRFWWFKLNHIRTERGVVSYFSDLFSGPEFMAALKQVEQEHG